jgi:hypothetical protein
MKLRPVLNVQNNLDLIIGKIQKKYDERKANVICHIQEKTHLNTHFSYGGLLTYIWFSKRKRTFSDGETLFDLILRNVLRRYW